MARGNGLFDFASLLAKSRQPIAVAEQSIGPPFFAIRPPHVACAITVFSVLVAAKTAAAPLPAPSAVAAPATEPEDDPFWLPDEATGGQGRVHLSTGDFVYNYPLVVPTGPRGLRPNLPFSYSAQENSESWVGVGWSLELGSIYRIGRTGGAPRLDQSDTFILQLDGASHRLVLVDPSGPIYHTEYETFMRVRPLGFGDRTFLSDGYWEVTKPDGTRQVFGARGGTSLPGHKLYKQTAAGPVPVAWVLTEVEDPFSNRIDYDYVKGTDPIAESTTGPGHNTIYPATVDYAGFHLDFELEPLLHPRSETRAGLFVQHTRRLLAIHVEAGLHAVNSYRLSYTGTHGAGRSFLSAITVVGRDGISTLPPLQFSYPPAWTDQFWGSGGTSLPQGPLVLANVDAREQTLTRALIHMSGRGAPDFVEARYPGDLYVNGLAWAQGIDAIQTRPFADGKYTRRTMDFDGDGKADHLTTVGASPFGILVHRNNGSGFDPAEEWLFPPDAQPDGLLGVFASNGEVFADLMDMNGDGWLDLVLASIRGFEWLVYLNRGERDANGLAFDLVSWPGTASLGPIMGALETDGQGIYTRGRKSLMVDMNGDGLPDHVHIEYIRGAPWWFVAYNTGTGFLDAVRFPGFQLPAWIERYAMGTAVSTGDQAEGLVQGLLDMNGDGLPDITRSAAGDTTDPDWQVYYNSGSGFEPWTTRNFNPSGTGPGGRLSWISWSNCLINTDYNADRTPDLLYACGASHPDHGFNKVHPRTHSPECSPVESCFADLATKIDHPLGAETRIHYGSLATSLDSFLSPRPFAVQHKTGARADYVIQKGYSYDQDRTYRSSDTRLFLGFRQVWEAVYHISPRGDEIKEHYYEFAQNIWDVGTQLLKRWSRPSYTLSYEETQNTSADRERPYFAPINSRSKTRSWYSQNNTLFSVTSKVDYQYDSYGNRTVEIHHGDISITGDERTVRRSFVANESAWIVSLPASEQIAEGAGTSEVVKRETRHFYDGRNHAAPPLRGFLSKTDTGLGSLGSVTKYNHDAGGAYGEDPYGNVTSVTDPNGNRTTTTFDSEYHTFAVATTNALEHITRSAYYGVGGEPLTGGYFGRPKWVLDPTAGGNANRTEYRTSFAYDVFGRIVKLTKPYDDVVSVGDPGTAFYTYSLTGGPHLDIVERETPSLLRTRTLWLDGLGRVERSVRPGESGDIYVDTTYEHENRIESRSAPSYFADLGHRTTVFYYDELGRLRWIGKPDGTWVHRAYEGWDTIVSDELNRQTTYTEDAYGNIVAVKDALGYTTSYDYDALDNLIKVTDHLGNTTTWTYDALSRKTAIDDPDRGYFSYEYDAAGNLVREAHRNGSVDEAVLFTYDALNRPTRKQEEALPNRGTSFFYDQISSQGGGIGKLTAMGRDNFFLPGRSYTWFAYDRRGRKVEETRTTNADATPIESYTTRWSYDSMDRVTEIIHPNHFAADYIYNVQGKVEAITGIVDNVDYSAAGRETRIDYANGATSTFTYDIHTDRILSIVTDGAWRYQDLSYAYDARGNLTSKIDHTSAREKQFRYDALDRLTSVEEGVPGMTMVQIERFQYDAIGNLTFKDGLQRYETGTTPDGRWYGGPRAVSQINRDGASHSLFYDSRGNLESGLGRDYTYDYDSRVIDIQAPALAVRTGFEYDAHGNRLYKEVEQGGAVTGSTTYGGPGFIELGNGSNTAYVFLNSRRVASVNEAGTPAESVFYYHADHLGSTSLVTDAATNIVEAVDYKAFGESRAAAPASGDTLQNNESQVLSEATAGAEKHFSITVPEGATSLLAQISGGTGDADLYLRFGAPPTTSQFDCRPYRNDNNETCNISGTSLRVGTWYVMVRSFRAYSDVTLRASHDGLANGRQVRELAAAAGSERRFQMVVAAGKRELVLQLSGGTGDADLYVRFGSPPTTTDYDCRPYSSNSNEKCAFDAPAAGTWHIMVRGYSTYSDATLYAFCDAAAETRYQFTGQELDPSTGLYHYGARLYDPTIGRFLAADPFIPDPFNPQALNPYSYVLNNPLLYIDPSGYFLFLPPGWTIPFLNKAAEYATSWEFWTGFVDGAISGAMIGRLCTHWCVIGGALVGGIAGGILNHEAGQAGASDAWVYVNSGFKVASAAASGYTAGGSAFFGIPVKSGLAGAATNAGRAAIGAVIGIGCRGNSSDVCQAGRLLYGLEGFTNAKNVFLIDLATREWRNLAALAGNVASLTNEGINLYLTAEDILVGGDSRGSGTCPDNPLCIWQRP